MYEMRKHRMAKIEVEHEENTLRSSLFSPLKKVGISFCTSKKQIRMTPPTIRAKFSIG